MDSCRLFWEENPISEVSIRNVLCLVGLRSFAEFGIRAASLSISEWMSAVWRLIPIFFPAALEAAGIR